MAGIETRSCDLDEGVMKAVNVDLEVKHCYITYVYILKLLTLKLKHPCC